MENLCRICLQNNAAIHIFESNGESSEVYSKLCACVNEKIEDIDGYPRRICSLCNDTLQTVNDFIEKYKRSCELLKSALFIKTDVIKNEVFITEGCSPTEYSNFTDVWEMKDFNDDDFVLKIKNEPENDLASRENTTTNKIDKLIENKALTIKKITSKTKPRLRNRFKNAKSRTNNLKIKNCDSTAKLKSDSIKVKKEKDNIAKKPVEKMTSKLCHLCGIVVELKAYHQHQTQHQTQYVKCEIPCPKCNKTITSRYNLSRHILRVHSEVKKHKCYECDSRFAIASQRDAHYRVVHQKHKRNKKHSKCKICNKLYTTSKMLLIHTRSAHTGERPAVCDHCGAAFYHEDYLKEHRRLHTGEAPYKCLVCGKGHAQRGNMKTHLRVHSLSELDPDVLKKLKPTMFKYFKKV